LRIATKSKSDLIKNNITFCTNVTHWYANGTASNIARMTDGNTSSSGALDYWGGVWSSVVTIQIKPVQIEP
jgi:hypothetical protein